MRRFFVGIVFFISLVVLVVPWTQLFEKGLKQALLEKGISNLIFSVESIGLNNIDFNNIEFGELKLPALSVRYHPFDIIDGNFNEIHAGEISFYKAGAEIVLSGVDVNLTTGLWQVNTIKINGVPLVIPLLSGQGNIVYQDKIISLSGEIKNMDKKFLMNFSLNYPTVDSKEAVVNIKDIFLPWNDGVVSATNVVVPIYSTMPVKVDLGVKHVSLNALLVAATGNKATATGSVSGVVPVVLERDGRFAVKKGSLKADNPGIINMSPDVIPSDAPEVALLRDVLQEFHYEAFSMGVESIDTKQLVMLLSLTGNNPEVYNGRVVKFNVNLTGDVIELIMQSLAILKN